MRLRAFHLLAAAPLVALGLVLPFLSGRDREAWYAPSGERVVFDAEGVEFERPLGFERTERFRGLMCLESGATISVASLAAPADAVIGAFTDETLATKGIEVTARETLRIDGLEGLLLTAEQRSAIFPMSKLILCFGDEERTHQVTVSLPIESTEEAAGDLRSMLRAVTCVEIAVTSELPRLAPEVAPGTVLPTATTPDEHVDEPEPLAAEDVYGPTGTERP